MRKIFDSLFEYVRHFDTLISEKPISSYLQLIVETQKRAKEEIRYEAFFQLCSFYGHVT